MKKIIGLISLILIAVLVTGCGSNSGTITCVSEARGADPSTVTYETYVVENNEITEYTKYKVLKFSDEYLSKVSIDSVFEIYDKDTSYTTEKVDGKTLKTTYIAPRNLYSDMETDNMIETIRASFEDNDFLMEKYTCEIK